MILIYHKNKYNKYEDLNIVDFEDEIDLLSEINQQLIDGYPCVDIIANDATVRYLLSTLMTEFNFSPRRINMEHDNAIYCLELFDDGTLRVFLYDKYSDLLQGASIYLYQDNVSQKIVDDVLNYYADSDIWLFGYEDEDDVLVNKEDVSDLDIIAQIMQAKDFEQIPTLPSYRYLLENLWSL